MLGRLFLATAASFAVEYEVLSCLNHDICTVGRKDVRKGGLEEGSYSDFSMTLVVPTEIEEYLSYLRGWSSFCLSFFTFSLSVTVTVPSPSAGGLL